MSSRGSVPSCERWAWLPSPTTLLLFCSVFLVVGSLFDSAEVGDIVSAFKNEAVFRNLQETMCCAVVRKSACD